MSGGFWMGALRPGLMLAPVLVAGMPVTASAGVFASAVVSYSAGSAGAEFQSPSAALGAPDGVSGENPAATNFFGFPNVLSPFSPAYQGDEVVQIGEGGQITLRLANYVNVGPGKRLGVISNVGLVDASPTFNGGNGATAQAFGGGTAHVRVSSDGQSWVDLGKVTFDLPALYCVNAGPYDSTAPASPQLTDFGKPFEGTLASFDGKDFAGTVAAFAVAGGGYSGGGTWLDLSGTGLTQVGYVQFIQPDDGDPLTDHRLAIDAVSIANDAVGAATPEPSGLAGILLGAGLLRRRRRAF